MLGLRAPKLSFKQKELSVTRFAGNFGRAVGVTIGCLLGMFPLLFLGGREERKEEQGERKEESGLGGEKGTVMKLEMIGESEPADVVVKTVASGVEEAVVVEMVISSAGESTEVVKASVVEMATVVETASEVETVGSSGEA